MKKILEIGSGHGFNGSLLAKRNDYTGIDLDPTNINISRKRYPNINFQCGNAEKLNFCDNCFDEVYALDILEHVDNVELTIGEVYRVLKPSGLFYVNVPYYKSENWLLKIRPSYFSDMHHVRIFIPSDMNYLFSLYQFKLIYQRYVGFLQHIELFFLFKRKNAKADQTSIGSWRDNPLTFLLHICILFFQPDVIKTPLRFIPIWVITLPIGSIISSIGNKYFPKSVYSIYAKNGE